MDMSIAWNNVDDRTAGYIPGVNTASSAQKSDASFAKELSDIETGAGETHMGFFDFILGVIDVINPLQHIPIVSTIYRELTGDEISPAARLAGDALYGGPIGAAVAMADIVIEDGTGKDLGGNVMAMVMGDEHEDAPVMLAQAAAQVEPAAGEGEIIWDTPAQNNSTNIQDLLSSTPTPSLLQTAAATIPRLAHSTPIAPQGENGTQNAVTNGRLTAAADRSLHVTVTKASLPQKTPASRPETGLSPGLIAQEENFLHQVPQAQIPRQMAEALDKYAVMKNTGL